MSVGSSTCWGALLFTLSSSSRACVTTMQRRAPWPVHSEEVSSGACRLRGG